MPANKLAIVHDFVKLACGALAQLDVVAEDSKIDAARENGFRLVKTEYHISYYGKTANEGPILVGMAANLTAAQIEEALETDPQSQTEDDVAGNPSMRPVWPIAIVPYGESADENFGKHGELAPKWSIPEGEQLSFWAYNMNTGAALTTGTIVYVYAKHYGVWLRD